MARIDDPYFDPEDPYYEWFPGDEFDMPPPAVEEPPPTGGVDPTPPPEAPVVVTNPPLNAPTPPAGPSVGGNPRGGGGGGGFDLGPLLQSYPGVFQKPTPGAAFKQLSDLLGPAPEFSAPVAPEIEDFSYESFAEPEPFAYEDYAPTTGEHVFSDPSFGFRKGIGEDALMKSRAAQGLLRTGGTLKDLLDYNQNFASQEFGNVDARRMRDYGTNRGNALENYQTNLTNKFNTYGANRGNAFENWKANKDTRLGLYDRGFEAERAKYEPRLFEWTKKGDLGMRAEEKAYDDSFREFRTDYDMWRTQGNDVFDRLKWASEFGLDAATR